MPVLLEGYLLGTSVSHSQLQLSVCDLNPNIFLCCRAVEQIFQSYTNPGKKAEEEAEGFLSFF